MFTDKYINEGRTKLEEGDVVVCIKTRDDKLNEGKEYTVYESGYAGEFLVITEKFYRYDIIPKQGGYCCTNTEEHWFRKKENVMGKEFKSGDWVFETQVNGKIKLEKLSQKGGYVSTGYASYNKLGINEQMPISKLVQATKENRQALVTLYGEQEVPKLELSGGEAVKYLLGLQKWVLCWVSNDSEAHAREGNVVALIDCADTILPFGSFYDGGDDWDYAVPIDMNGDELTISLVGWD